jgi:DNA-binding NarL/FixJ family response regulator
MLPVSVQIFAAHPVAAARYRQVVSEEPDLRLATQERCVDVGLFDGELPYLEATLTMARLSCPSMRPLLMASPSDEDWYLRWMFRGVRGVVSYDAYARELPQAIRKLAQGLLYFPPQIIGRWRQLDSRVRVRAQSLPLTHRELEVAGLLSRRLSNKQIGVALGLTERTVKFHVGNILTKLRLGSRYELYAVGLPGELPSARHRHPISDSVPLP